MAIKVKAIERNVSFTKGEEKWAHATGRGNREGDFRPPLWNGQK